MDDVQFTFSDVADHWVFHRTRWIGRARLKDHISQSDRLESGLKNLALREFDRVGRTSETLELGRKGLEHLLALGVLADGLSERAVIQLVETGACERPNTDFVEALSRSPWWKNGRLMRLQPDAPAAAFLDLALFNQGFPR